MTDGMPGTGGPDYRVANVARVYNCWLGGKDHGLADRRVAAEVLRCRPEIVAGVRANRAFGRRVTWYAAFGCRIRQFLDIGTGLPAPGATHETAQRAHPDCRVVYADNDPVVLAHARALLTPSGEGVCGYIDADVRDPARLLAQAAVTLDFSRPVAILLLAVLHFLGDQDDPAGIVAALAGALAPGSVLAISHVTADYATGPVTDSIAAYNQAVPVQVHPRDRAAVTDLFGTLPVRWPGIVPVSRWQPPFQESPGRPVDIYGGVARLPGDHHDRAAILELAATPPPGPVRYPDRELAERAAQYPGHHIQCEINGDSIRYVARSTGPGISPHTVITASPDELFDALAAARRSTAGHDGCDA